MATTGGGSMEPLNMGVMITLEFGDGVDGLFSSCVRFSTSFASFDDELSRKGYSAVFRGRACCVARGERRTRSTRCGFERVSGDAFQGQGSR